MKNIEKYYDAIKQKLQTTNIINLYCAVNDLRTGCDDCPEWRNCRECCLKNLEWLNQEYKEHILDDAEKEYLSNVIKPFRNRVRCIRKYGTDFMSTECIFITFIDGFNFIFPSFKKGTMYKCMELDRNYTLEELGLENVNG